MHMLAIIRRPWWKMMRLQERRRSIKLPLGYKNHLICSFKITQKNFMQDLSSLISKMECCLKKKSLKRILTLPNTKITLQTTRMNLTNCLDKTLKMPKEKEAWTRQLTTMKTQTSLMIREQKQIRFSENKQLIRCKQTWSFRPRLLSKKNKFCRLLRRIKLKRSWTTPRSFVRKAC